MGWSGTIFRSPSIHLKSLNCLRIVCTVDPYCFVQRTGASFWAIKNPDIRRMSAKLASEVQGEKIRDGELEFDIVDYHYAEELMAKSRYLHTV